MRREVIVEIPALTSASIPGRTRDGEASNGWGEDCWLSGVRKSEDPEELGEGEAGGSSKGEGLEQEERRASANWALSTAKNGDVESNGGFGIPSMIVLWTSLNCSPEMNNLKNFLMFQCRQMRFFLSTANKCDSCANESIFSSVQTKVADVACCSSAECECTRNLRCGGFLRGRGCLV